MGGKNKYLINGINVQNKRVSDMFCSVQLNVNNPHFLIMQGRITKVLNMKPPEVSEKYTTLYKSHQKMPKTRVCCADPVHGGGGCRDQDVRGQEAGSAENYREEGCQVAGVE